MTNLKVNLLGKTLKNPIITASGTFGFGREYNEFYDIGELGGVCTKGLTLNKKLGNKSPRIAETASGIINSVGLQNPGVRAFIENDLNFLKDTGTCVIANIAGSTLDEYVEMAKIIDETDVDMVEVNISCPNVKEGGMAFGVDPKSVERVTSAIRKNTTKPIIMKLSPNVANIQDNARAVEVAGGDAVSLINTVGGMAVNYKTRRPILNNVFGGLSGECIKPIALKMVWQTYNAIKLPIIGMGGISKYTDVLEFMLCGATAVEVGTANFTDPMASYNIVKDLEKFVLENDVDINEYVGKLIVD
ncbi:MAG: dihydroorotate dehydrogenase [Clostridia bacterium]|nr:dihydroorotate dehydrogenase [Clostridia bacterium]MDY5263809.1 dihydroorotate dehydrogenase [Eubacteriales bacterium]